MERLLKSMNIYTRWLSRHCDALEDRNRSIPLAHLGRTMSAHAAELPDTEYSRRLASMGNANEQLAELQTTYLDCANGTWQQHIEQNLGMMKEYQVCRSPGASSYPSRFRPIAYPKIFQPNRLLGRSSKAAD